MASAGRKNVPFHIALIPDGNRRWAKRKGLGVLIGHDKGIENLANMLKWCREAGVRVFTAWGFSTENFSRDRSEVQGLMKLFEKKLLESEGRNEVHKYRIRVRVLGRIGQFPKKVQEKIREVMEKTKHYDRYYLNILLGYGGRQELIDAVQKLVREGKGVSEQGIANSLYTSGIPDPDLVIRTSGEQRTSGFLPWQSAYSEWYFSKKLWPDFTKRDFKAALREYARRKRRFGK